MKNDFSNKYNFKIDYNEIKSNENINIKVEKDIKKNEFINSSNIKNSQTNYEKISNLII